MIYLQDLKSVVYIIQQLPPCIWSALKSQYCKLQKELKKLFRLTSYLLHFVQQKVQKNNSYSIFQ